MNKVRKELIPFICTLALVFLNFPLVLIAYFYFYDYLEKIMLIAAGIECILLGFSIAYIGIHDKMHETRNKAMTRGRITGFKLVNKNGNWIKKPVIMYRVGGREYEASHDLGFDGVFRFLMIGRGITIYYNERNPEDTYVLNKIPYMLGAMFLSIGIYMLIFL